MKFQGYLIGGLLLAIAGFSFAQGSDEYGFSKEEMCALTAETAPDTDYTTAYEACMGSGSISAPVPQPYQKYDDNPDTMQESQQQGDVPQDGYEEYNEQQGGNEYNEQQDSYQEEAY